MTRKEVANFVAQASHESYNLTRLNEGFRYTKGIQQITTKTPSALRNGKHELEVARQDALHGKPEHLAELMYGGRIGNDKVGDGWKYHGRSYIQLTGKDNYREIGKLVGLDLVNNPDLAEKPENAPKITLAFWKHNVPKHARENPIKATKAVNGEIGTDVIHRSSLYEQFYKKFTPEFLESIKDKMHKKDNTQQQLQKLHPQAKNLYGQIEALCRAEAKKLDINWSKGMENTVYTLATAAMENGLKQVTHLALSEDNKIINIGDLSADRHLYAQVNVKVAAETEALQSLEIINQIAQNNEQEKINKQMQQQETAQTYNNQTMKL